MGRAAFPAEPYVLRRLGAGLRWAPGAELSIASSLGSSLILNTLFKYLLVVMPSCNIHSGEKRHPYREQKGAVNFHGVLEKCFLTLLTGSLCSSPLPSPPFSPLPSSPAELTVGHGHLSEPPFMQKQKPEESQLLVPFWKACCLSMGLWRTT